MGCASLAVVIGAGITLALRTVITHRSYTVAFVLSVLAVLLWEAGLYAEQAVQTDAISPWINEWLMLALVSGVAVVGLRLGLPHGLRHISRYIRFPQ